MNLNSKAEIVERIILLKTARKNYHPFKRYADLFNTQTIFKHCYVPCFLTDNYLQCITYDIIDDLTF